MIRIITFFLLLLSIPGISQTYINKSKSTVKKELAKFSVANNNLKTILTETDSFIVFLIRDPRTRNADFIYGFDQSGKCSSEKTMAGCDSCQANFLRNVLNQKKYEWVKINENQYVSKFSEKLMIELPENDKDYSFIILRMDWSKILYDMLLKK